MSEIKYHWQNLSLENIVINVDGLEITEEWKPVVGYEGLYEVSSMGRVKTLERERSFGVGRNGVRRYKTKINKGVANSNGYIQYSLSKKCVNKIFHVHRLVAEYFIINSESKPEVNHIDGDKSNPLFTNLEWNTRSENQIHAKDMGLDKSVGESHRLSKFTNDQIVDIYKSPVGCSELSKKYDVTFQCIWNIKKGVNWVRVTQKIH